MPRINIAGEITSAPHNNNYIELYDKASVAETNISNLQTDVLNLQTEDTNLQTQITSNSTNILNLQTEDANLQTQITSNDTDILNLQTEDTNLQTQITNNATDITSINTNYTNHINGIADKHSAKNITYLGEVAGQLDVKGSIDSLQLQINAITAGGGSGGGSGGGGGTNLDPRVTEALVDSRSITHTTLKERLDNHETHAMPHSFKDQTNRTYIYGLRQVGNRLIFSYEELI